MPQNGFHPNVQQQHIVAAVAARHPVVIVNAFAGTGKTSVLEFIAQTIRRPAAYLVFNRKNADEARKRLPAWVQVGTAHSWAYRAPHPDNNRPMVEFYPRLLPTYHLVRQCFGQENISQETMVAITATLRSYCQSQDARVGEQHVPAAVHHMSQTNRYHPPEWYVMYAQAVFDHLRRTPGETSHDIYLKLYSLQSPALKGDLLFIDEAQDLNPCMLNIIEKQIQCGKQVVLVGDRYQHIYGFNGAIDAMAVISAKYQGTELPLTGSYRFGENIAAVANQILARMGCSHQIHGLARQPGVIRDMADAPAPGQAVIYRKNISMLHDLLRLPPDLPVQVVGGVQELSQMLQSAFALYKGERTDHPEIGMFRSWEELVTFAESDAGRHLWPVVSYIEEQHGIHTALAVLTRIEKNNQPHALPENTLILTTAHKSKGLEFNAVQLSSDMEDSLETDNVFILPPRSREAMLAEMALLYVAATRARVTLNLGGIGQRLRGLEQFPCRLLSLER